MGEGGVRSLDLLIAKKDKPYRDQLIVRMTVALTREQLDYLRDAVMARARSYADKLGLDIVHADMDAIEFEVTLQDRT